MSSIRKRVKRKTAGSAGRHSKRLAAAVLAIVLLWCFSCPAAENLKLSGEADCLICNISFATIVNDARPEKTAIDGRPMNTRFLPLPECPLCGGVFSQGVFSSTENKILAEVIWTSDYQQLRSLDSWYRHAKLLEATSHSDDETAEAYLRASWAADHDPVLQEKYRLTALKFFLRHIEDTLRNDNDAATADFSIFLKVGELFRQLKRFDEAGKWLKKMQQNVDFRTSYQPMVINHVQQLVEQKNSDIAAMPDGNRLHQAVAENDRPAFDTLLQQKRLLDEFNLADLTPLMLAVSRKQTEMVKMLIKAGSDLKTRTAKGKTALHMACEAGKHEIIELLVHDSDLINVADNFARTALHYAAISSNAPLLKLLLAKGADPLVKDGSGNSMLHFMAQHLDDFADLETAKSIIGLFPDLNARNFNDFTPFHLAAGSGNQLMAGLLANAKANINARLPDGGNALFFCQPDMIAFLIELGVKTDTTNNLGQTAFVVARLAGNRQRIAQFKQTRAYRQQEEFFEISGKKVSIYTAIVAKDIDSVKQILKIDPSQINAREKSLGETPLHTAALAADSEIVELLLKSGANINAANDFLRTPLHYATGNGNHELTKIFCEAGANIFALDARGSTPLHDAAAARHRKVYHFLKDLGASDSTLNNEGHSPAALLEEQL